MTWFTIAGCNQPPNTPDSAPLPSDEEIRKQLDEVLDYTYQQRHLDLDVHAAWQILHGALAYQREFQVRRDGELVSAVDHILSGGAMEGWTVRRGNQDTATGRRGLRAVLEVGTKTGQGHADQWLAVLAQCGLPPDQPIQLGGQTYTMQDYVNQVEWDVPHNRLAEYSWTLIGLTAYRPTGHQWTASDGKQWSIERLVRIEVEQDLSTSACGGSHRLIGLSMALNQHQDQQGQVEGVWKLAEEKIQDAIDKARQFQNPDGSFSARYFERPGTTADLAEDLGTTGHTLELLTFALTNQQLKEPWVKRAVVHLCDLFDKTKGRELECGALYHAAHSLVVYRQRVYGPRSFSQSPPERKMKNEETRMKNQ